MNNLKKYPLIIFFAVLLYSITILDLFSSTYEYSELENRPLASFPAFSVNALFDNEYTPDIEEFTNDHFLMRDSWISLKSISETFLLKGENNSIVYGDDGYMFTKFLTVSNERLNNNITALNTFANRHEDINITFALAPTSATVLSDKVDSSAPVLDSDEIINTTYSNLEIENTLDISSVLKEHSDEYIYYRTDHHWTTLGAYYAYEEFMNSINKPYTPLESYDIIDVDSFLGTHYSKAKSFNVIEDTLSYIDITAEIQIGEDLLNIYDLEKLDSRDKYAMFLRGNFGYTQISGTGQSSILVLKDSYANCFIPFMVNDFESIHIIDLRYFNQSLDALIEEFNYDNILFLYNTESFVDDWDIPKINLFND